MSDLCPPGMYSLTGLMPCEPCPIGSHQSEAGTKSCIKCRDGLTTAGVGSYEENHCQGNFKQYFNITCPCVTLLYLVHFLGQ